MIKRILRFFSESERHKLVVKHEDEVQHRAHLCDRAFTRK